MTIGAQIFVAETTHDLIVTIESGHHQQLFEYLWRLRQCKKLAGMGAARNDVVACTFGSRPRQHRRFDVDKTVIIEKVSHRFGDFVSQHQVGRHIFTPQIEVAILQAQLLARLLVMMERRRFRAIENLKFVRKHFDLPRRHIRIDRAFRTFANQPFYRQHVLTANALSRCENLGAIRIKNDLQQALTIAKINKDHAAVIPSAVDPATDRDFLSDQRLINLTAIMATHGAFPGRTP